MIPYARTNPSELCTISQTKLLENHTLHSGIYPYLIWLIYGSTLLPPPLCSGCTLTFLQVSHFASLAFSQGDISLCPLAQCVHFAHRKNLLSQYVSDGHSHLSRLKLLGILMSVFAGHRRHSVSVKESHAFRIKYPGGHKQHDMLSEELKYPIGQSPKTVATLFSHCKMRMHSMRYCKAICLRKKRYCLNSLKRILHNLHNFCQFLTQQS